MRKDNWCAIFLSCEVTASEIKHKKRLHKLFRGRNGTKGGGANNERNGTTRYVAEWNGRERKGTGRNGRGRKGAEWNGTERNKTKGMEQNGVG